MAKAKKQGDNKPRVRVRFLNVLLVLLGADLILLFAPGIGILNSVFYIGPAIGWSALVIGAGLLVFGFRDLYQKQ
ncbi:hypothetical protein INT08_01215 [Prosthecochloris sp. N3]|uniref:Uncharacterized protein n=1 Tax=Prosthecochloris ethylica TaxID=2743976 RepID=A0ABR9XP60_9CHLB|nr:MULTISPECIES: hypothetical protein [Prosthecochloris]MEC9486408.1 hypothetical protein [Prosthecochloris sp.]MBF0585892.1 hypothetical protein [Prosthecochloris ethylica]MBF0635802.1 hypothetical protein [Prosthecochloris ethylica]NUK47100.1 hypothetical protein [Prosthecochloris ethylica]RNA65578.1 hypothetical protein CR163_010345 [Prosthecochloris sp. ZM_2]